MPPESSQDTRSVLIGLLLIVSAFQYINQLTSYSQECRPWIGPSLAVMGSHQRSCPSGRRRRRSSRASSHSPSSRPLVS